MSEPATHSDVIWNFWLLLAVIFAYSMFGMCQMEKRFDAIDEALGIGQDTTESVATVVCDGVTYPVLPGSLTVCAEAAEAGFKPPPE